MIICGTWIWVLKKQTPSKYKVPPYFQGSDQIDIWSIKKKFVLEGVIEQYVLKLDQHVNFKQ